MDEHGLGIAVPSLAADTERRKEGSMSRAWKIALLVALILLFGMVVSLAWSAPQTTASNMPAFTPKDHKLIEDYYVHFLGTLAPGSLDRSEFSLAIEQSLTSGSHVPMQLERDLK